MCLPVIDPHRNSLVFVFLLFQIYLFSTQCLSIVRQKIAFQSNHANTSFIVVIMIYASYSFGLTFIACELGHREIYSFVAISNRIEELNWYLFPIDVQKMMPIIIQNAVEPIEIGCFGSITCKRDSFKKVCPKTLISSQYLTFI